MAIRQPHRLPLNRFIDLGHKGHMGYIAKQIQQFWRAISAIMREN
jgi:hypothetical protein